MASIFTSTAVRSLKRTLMDIATDEGDGAPGLTDKVFDVYDMEDIYEDVVDYGGPGFASSVDEGADVPMKTITEGPQSRIIAQKFGLTMGVSEEMLKAGKYNRQVINQGQRMSRSLYQTREQDHANVFARMFNASYVGADNLSLANSAHTTPDGSTFSNTMTVPFAAGRAAYIVARTQVAKWPGYNGIVGTDIHITGILCPVDVGPAWWGVVSSDKAPESNSNEKNIVAAHLSESDVMEWVYWSNSTTNYAFLTDADNGLYSGWFIRPKASSWEEERKGVMFYKRVGMWGRMWVNPRRVLGVNA